MSCGGALPAELGGDVPPAPPVVTAAQILPLRICPDGHSAPPVPPPSTAMALQFGHVPVVPSGQCRGSGLRQVGQSPIIPFSAQLATGLSLQSGHFPIVPFGQSRTMVLQSGHLPAVP
jgi:hypothetical protein